MSDEKRIEVLRGQMYYANLDPVIGSEQGGFRPVLVIQNDVGSNFSPTVIVTPITSKQKKCVSLLTLAYRHISICLKTQWPCWSIS